MYMVSGQAMTIVTQPTTVNDDLRNLASCAPVDDDLTNHANASPVNDDPPSPGAKTSGGEKGNGQKVKTGPHSRSFPFDRLPSSTQIREEISQ